MYNNNNNNNNTNNTNNTNNNNFSNNTQNNRYIYSFIQGMLEGLSLLQVLVNFFRTVRRGLHEAGQGLLNLGFIGFRA